MLSKSAFAATAALVGDPAGAQVIDLVARKSVGRIDCEHWLLGALDLVSDAETGIARSAAIGGGQVVGTGAHSTEDQVDRDRSHAIAAEHSPLLQPGGSPAMASPFSRLEAAMPNTASGLARRLAANAEAVCRHYGRASPASHAKC